MSELEHTPAELASRRKRNRRIAGAVAVVVALGALVLTPPLLNVSRLRTRMAASMSTSMGRPVHLDNLTLNVLPFPGFTLSNLVVSEDPSFGSEPVIRANTVTARLRLSSLWRRQVEVSSISFQEPSVNLVRRPDGRWNIESILIHAAQEDTAPTAQTTAGPAPRFPYIEATGARVNVKLGEEKMPLALTDADFALWLPSPQQWRVRLEAKPSRTDTSSSDTGLLRVEATLERAAHLSDVPVELNATWRGAPLGEASRLVTGNDAGWRGNVEATANLHGTLGDAALHGTMKLSNVRRADYIPANPLNLNVDCNAQFAVSNATMDNPQCVFAQTPVSHLGFGAVAPLPSSAVYVTADSLQLTGMRAANLRVGTPSLSLEWLLDFARLWSQRIPAEETAKGTVSGSFSYTADAAHFPWDGSAKGTITAQSLDSGADAKAEDRTFSVSTTPDGLTLAPFNLTPDARTSLELSGMANNSAFSYQISGTATENQLKLLSSRMPPLADGLDSILPNPAPAGAQKVDLTCTRNWGSTPTCTAARAPEPRKPAPKHHR